MQEVLLAVLFDEIPFKEHRLFAVVGVKPQRYNNHNTRIAFDYRKHEVSF
jgi:hypothetical protein